MHNEAVDENITKEHDENDDDQVGRVLAYKGAENG